MGERPLAAESLAVSDFARQALKQGVFLGRNPERTLKYYNSIGLLKPYVVRNGPIRRALYSIDQLIVLKYIDTQKKRGRSLDEIKQDLHQKVLLSQKGLEFIGRFKGRYPDTAFQPGAPVTRAEFAFLMARASEECGWGRRLLEFTKDFLVVPSGESAMDGFDFGLGGPSAGRKDDGSSETH